MNALFVYCEHTPIPKDITLFLFDIKFSMDVSSVLWVHVFSYLDEKDQASVAANDFWKALSSQRGGVARIRYFRDRKVILFHPTEDVLNIGAPYLSKTMIMNAHF